MTNLQQENAALRERVAQLENAIAVELAAATMHIVEADDMTKHDYRQMANFVSAVRLMRNTQKQYFARREKDVLLLAKQAEHIVDNTIENDIFFIELLKSYKAPLCLNK